MRGKGWIKVLKCHTTQAVYDEWLLSVLVSKLLKKNLDITFLLAYISFYTLSVACFISA